MKVLITGANGQVGSALIDSLHAWATVVATDRSMLDLSKPEAIPAEFDRIGPDAVINAAAYTAVDNAEAEPDIVQLVNADAPGTMARWAAERDVPFLHFSSDYIFDGSGQGPWSESDTPRPLSVYGASKLAGEEQVCLASGPSLIIRTSWVYGARGRNFMRTIARAATTKQELRVVSDQIGAPTSAALIADAVTAMLADGLDAFRARAKEASGLVHLAASGETSWHGFACEIVSGLRARGVELAVERIVPIATADWPTPARRPLNSRLNLGRLRAIFGVEPPDWRAALAPELDKLAHRDPAHVC
jgi:dTDP-4-dehydrorhamnose reductase